MRSLRRNPLDPLARARLALRVVAERLRVARIGRRPLRILFSRQPHWQRRIELGFLASGHRLVFAADSESLIERCQRERFDLVVPLDVRELRAISALGASATTGLLPIPTLAVIDLCDDKPRLHERLVALGHGACVPAMGGTPVPPYVLKPRRGAGSAGIHLVRTAEDDSRLAATRADPAYFAQAFVPGRHEHATHVLMKDGRILRSLTIRHTFATEQPILQRTPRRFGSVVECAHLERFGAILRDIGFEGICCIDHKPSDPGDPRSRPIILEINPRCGGSLVPFLGSFLAALDPRSAPRD